MIKFDEINFNEILKKIAIPLFVLLLIVGVAVGVVNFQKMKKDPELTLDQPAEGAIIQEEGVKIMGKTDNSKNKVTVNQVEVPVSKDGSFESDFKLSEGENIITVETVSGSGRATSKTVNISKATKTAEQPKGEGEASGQVLGGKTGEAESAQAPAEGQTSLSQAGPVENAVIALSSVIFFGYLYLKSRRLVKNSLK